MKGNRKLLILLILCSALLLGACTQARPLANEDGEMWELKPGELTEGIYIRSGNIFQIPLKYGLTFSSSQEKVMENRVVWLCDMRRLIPELNANTELIVYSPDKYPDAPLILEHFTSVGYSLGALFKRQADGSLLFPTSSDNVCPDSAIAAAINAEVKSAQDTRIVELNEDPFPMQLVSEAGYITGLRQNGKYQIGFYEGTRYRQFFVVADTEIFLQDAVYSITKKEQTKNGYFVVKMSPDMPNGIYCINGSALILYEGSEFDALPTPEPSVSPTPEPTSTPIVGTIDTTPDSFVEETPPVIIMQEITN